MDELTLTEFSIFYKRLMVVEICLKSLIIAKYNNVFGDKAFPILYRYIQSLDKNRGINDKTFKKIFSSNKTNFEKLILSINKMYLGELLNLFANPVFLKNKAISKNFFQEQVVTNSTEFQQKAKAYRDFRNCVAHCNIRKYKLERNRLINGLVFFEKILQCNVIISCDIIDKISKTRKLSVKEILMIIYNAEKDYFKNDKLLIILFDDIALINGYTFKSLPQRWSIIRQKFELEKAIKNGNKIEPLNPNDNIQMNLPFHI